MTVSDAVSALHTLESQTGQTAEGTYSSVYEWIDHEATLDEIPVSIRNKEISYFNESFNALSTHPLRFAIVYKED